LRVKFWESEHHRGFDLQGDCPSCDSILRTVNSNFQPIPFVMEELRLKVMRARGKRELVLRSVYKER